MSLDNYANLQTAIGSWLNRSDLTSNITDFIAIAEFQMRRRFQMALTEGKMLPRKMVTSTSVTITAATEFESLPADFLGALSFYLDPQTVNAQTVGAVQLDYVSPANLEYQKQRRGPNATNSMPGLYSIVGAQLQFLPIPDYTYTGTLYYWQDFVPLATSPNTNWIFANWPDAYLYGALTQSAPFLMDDSRLQMWATLFAQTVDDIIASDPLPNDRSWLRMDSGLLFKTDGMSAFNITSGDFYNPP